MPPRPLRNYEIQNYYQDEPRFNGVYSRNNLPKINLNKSKINLKWVWIDRNETHWIALYGYGDF